MQLTMIGHAGVAIEAGGLGIVCDPWTIGTAFNDAWAADPTPVFDDRTRAAMTHLWISHEHPDHLSIPTLKAMPAADRARTEVLFQRHWSSEVVRFLGTLGFAGVRELVHRRPVDLGGGVRVTTEQFGHEDAVLVVTDGTRTVINLNDCRPTPRWLAALAHRHGPVDALLVQFSFAGWPGNPGEYERHRALADRTLARTVEYARVSGAAAVVPFASFARFCHEENAYVNAAAVPVARAHAAIGNPSVVLAPGDRWTVGAPATGTATDALARYAAAEAAAEGAVLLSHPPVPIDDVLAAAEANLERLTGAFGPAVRRLAPPVVVELTDLDRRLVLDLRTGRATLAAPAGRADDVGVLAVSSQAAAAALRTRWGIPTLLISARMRLHGPERPFRRFKLLGSAYGAGFHSRGLARDLVRPQGVDLARRAPDVTRELVARLART